MRGHVDRLAASHSELCLCYGDILHNSMDAIISAAEPGGICIFNPVAQSMFGWSEDDVRGKPLRMLLRGPRPGVDAEERELDTVAPGPCVQMIGLRKDGSSFPALARITSRCGPPELRTAIVRDMSRQDALERELVQAKKLASIGLLTASVAHDFNNALTALQAQLHVARARVGQLEELADCQEIVDRCAGLTRLLFATCMPDTVVGSAGDAARVDLAACAREALRIAGRLFPSDVRLEAELGGAHALVRGNPDLIVHAIINLLLNARDAVAGGGTVSAIITSASSDHYELSIRDSGKGMDAATLRRALDPFFTTKAGRGGTGLGLTSVQRIIEKAGGRLEIESRPGAGTCVTLVLPKAAPVPPRP